MYKTLLCTVQHYKLISPAERVVAGVSGGADSLALMHVLNRMRAVIGFELHIATLDHGLRGDDGASDVQFVKQLASNWKIPVTTGYVDTGQLAHEQKMGIEQAARFARYRFFDQVAQQTASSVVAVAHHADDNAETILMHLIRGSGTKGMAGMLVSSPVPGYPHLRLIRPMLYVGRSDVELYCQEHGLAPHHDISNDDTRFVRNLLRVNIIPQLKAINPRLSENLHDFADIFAVEDAYVTEMYERSVSRLLKQTRERVLLAREVYDQLHVALQRRFIIDGIRRLGGFEIDVSYENVINAVEIASRGNVGSIALLAGGLRLRVDYDEVSIEWQNVSLPVDHVQLEPDERYVLNYPCEILVRDGRWRLLISDSGVAERAYTALHVPKGASLSMRTRRAGDRFCPQGMAGRSRKVKKWMIDKKIPQYLRDGLPIICCGDEIAAIFYEHQWYVAHGFASRGVSKTELWVRLEVED